MSAQSNRIDVNLTKHIVVVMGSLVRFDIIFKSVLGATINGLSKNDVTNLFNG
jgi:hypothetical protein